MSHQVDYHMLAAPHVAAYNRETTVHHCIGCDCGCEGVGFTYAKSEAACREVQGGSLMRMSWM